MAISPDLQPLKAFEGIALAGPDKENARKQSLMKALTAGKFFTSPDNQERYWAGLKRAHPLAAGSRAGLA